LFKTILFCTDFSESAHWAFTYALNLSKVHGSRLLILHVTPEPVHPEQLSIYLAPEKVDDLRISQKQGLERELNTHYLKRMDLEGFHKYQVLIKEGEAFYEIIQVARQEAADLIVMGTHGRTGLDHVFFGSTAERVVRKASCPVMTVRLPGKRFTMP
jgi:nucleotide-binding universal stress UspA family protein